ncbi:hypothetical protein AB1E18_017108 [Capra hircus]
MAAAGGRGRSNYGGGTEGGRVLKWLKRDKAGDQGLGDGVVEAEFVEALQECGTISSVVVMPKRRQALVEFEDVLEARNAMNYATDNQI